MKKHILTVLLLGVLYTGYAQRVKEAEVPTPVVKTVQYRYPYVEKVNWKNNGPDYTAKFKTEKEFHELWIADDGTVLRSVEEVRIENLPTPIRERIRIDFSALTIDAARRIEVPGKVTYVVKLNGAPAAGRTVTFTPDGLIEENKLD